MYYNVINNVFIYVYFFIFQQQFYICAFPGGELSVVLEGWIFKADGQLQCRWASSLEKIKRASIPNPNWQTYMILKLKGKRGMYT